ncbi:MAG: repeat-containing protein [Chitinophagaceae bacterium]|nr:repeat-containing protein [Chitinophagaceae bacterium]
MKHWFNKYKCSCIALPLLISLIFGQQARADNFLVTNDSPDDIPGSFRNALNGTTISSNNLPHVITFSKAITISNITSGYGFVHPTIIDGTSVPGYNGTPLIHLIGAQDFFYSVISFSGNTPGFSYVIKGIEISSITGSSVGLEIPASNVVIQDNVFHSLSLGMTIAPSCENLTIKGNKIGTDATGTIAQPNNTGIGIQGFTIADRNLIIEGNVISANKYAGISLSGTQAVCLSRSQGVKITGNFIGTDITGKQALGNLHGIYISGFSGIDIGGLDAASRNIISGNTGTGINISSSKISGIFTRGINIFNNYIGTDISGTEKIPNETGIYLSICTSDVVIGGNTSGTRNIISGNLKDGILARGADLFVVSNVSILGNYIGTEVTGKTALSNGRHGIFINGDAENIFIGNSTSGSGNLISGNGAEGIRVDGNDYDSPSNVNANFSIKDITISSNLIGLAVTGNRALPNNNGVVIESTVSNVLIGGEMNQGNTISGNTTNGVALLDGLNGLPTDIRVYGNRIGMDITGEVPVPNNDGVFIRNVDSTSIGRQSMGNVIAGNTRHGVWIQDKYNYGVQVCYNKIGVSASNKIVISNGYGILLEALILQPERATPPNTAQALSYRIGSHLTNDGGNIISGHRSGGIFISGIKSVSVANRWLLVENNTVQHNIAESGTLPEVKLQFCQGDFTIGGANPFSSNTILGPLVIASCHWGIVRTNKVGDHRGGIDLIENSFDIAIAENTVTNAITVAGDEGSDNNRITQNKITAPGKPINLHYGTNVVGNDNIQPPVVLTYSLESGIVSGTWPDYVHFTSAQGNKTNPLIELFSTNKDGNSALEFLGCTCVNADGTWQTTIKVNDSHKFIFATVTGPEFNDDVVVVKSLPVGGAQAASVDCPLEAQHCPVDVTWLNTSEFSNVLSIACGQISLDNGSEGCAAFEPTSLKLTFTHFEEAIEHFSVVVDYGDGSPVATIPDQTSVWGVYLSHQYLKAGSYTVTADVRVNDPDHPGSTIRYACMTSPESRPVTVDNCVPCDGCLPSFSPTPGSQYIFTAWVKEGAGGSTTYEQVKVFLDFIGEGTPLSDSIAPQGDIIEGWQRMEKTVTIPPGTEEIAIRIRNTSSSSVFIDDVRMHPFNASMKSFVYDPNTFRLMAELDANNYATFYEYDEEGGLVRVKKETERGVMTVKEARTNMAKKSQ